MRHAGFAELLDYLVRDLQAVMVSLRYGKRRDFSQEYLHLGKLVDEDVAFLMTGVARADSEHGDLSTMHYMPFLGNDLFAVEAPPPAIPPGKPGNVAGLEADGLPSKPAGQTTLDGDLPPPSEPPHEYAKPRNMANLKALHRDELTILPVTDPRMSDLDILDVEGNQVSEYLHLHNVRDAERYAKNTPSSTR